MSSLDLSKFTFIEGGRNLPNNKFTRNEMMQLSDVKTWRNKHSNTGLYLTAYVYDEEDQKEANLYGDFYLDFDSDEDFEKAREDAILAAWYLKQRITYNIPENLLRIYYSGKKGLHIVVPAEILGVKPDKHLNEYYKVMAKSISEQLKNGTVDEKIYDRRRLFRVPNSRHHDTGLFKIPLTYFELTNLSLDEIKQKAQMPVALQYDKAYEIARARSEFEKHIRDWENRFGQKFENRKKYNAKPLDFIPACIQEMLDTGPVSGQRNNTAAVLVGFFRRQGLSQQETWDKLVEWNRESLSESELKVVLESVYDNGYEYGCSTLETLATCVEHECPLYKRDK